VTGARRTDPVILGEALAFHAVDGPVLDASWGYGRIWSQALLERYHPTRLDIRPLNGVDVVGDWNALGEIFAPTHFVTALWDAPHLPDAGANGLVGGRGWGDQYGTYTPGVGADLRAKSICGLFEPFLTSVRQVLDPTDGTLIVKISDTVHAGELQWQPFRLWQTALDYQWTPCDYQVRQRAQPIDPKWRKQYHFRRGATHWMVFHTGLTCPGRGVDLVRTCPGCGGFFRPRRRDQATCGDRCRQRRHREGRTSR
jgi:hypothetical protein